MNFEFPPTQGSPDSNPSAADALSNEEICSYIRSLLLVQPVTNFTPKSMRNQLEQHFQLPANSLITRAAEIKEAVGRVFEQLQRNSNPSTQHNHSNHSNNLINGENIPHGIPKENQPHAQTAITAATNSSGAFTPSPPYSQVPAQHHQQPAVTKFEYPIVIKSPSEANEITNRTPLSNLSNRAQPQSTAFSPPTATLNNPFQFQPAAPAKPIVSPQRITAAPNTSYLPAPEAENDEEFEPLKPNSFKMKNEAASFSGSKQFQVSNKRAISTASGFKRSRGEAGESIINNSSHEEEELANPQFQQVQRSHGQSHSIGAVAQWARSQHSNVENQAPQISSNKSRGPSVAAYPAAASFQSNRAAPSAAPQSYSYANRGANHFTPNPNANNHGHGNPSSSSQDEDEYLDLGGNKRLSVAPFMGRTRVNIREYWSTEGRMVPTKKGVSLSIEQWQMILAAAPLIQEKIDAFNS
jgi:hypothetical protein